MTTTAELRELLAKPVSVPPVCEFADSPEITWRVQADASCGSTGTWLLVNGVDPPSPLCDKHADIIRQRLPEPLPYGSRLVRA